MDLSVERFYCLYGGYGADEMTCCVREMGFFEVDVTLHARCHEGDEDDDDGEGGEDDEG